MNKINKICKYGTEREAVYFMSKILYKEYIYKKNEFKKFIKTFIKFKNFFEWNNCDKNLIFDLIIINLKDYIIFDKKDIKLLKNKLNIEIGEINEKNQ